MLVNPAVLGELSDLYYESVDKLVDSIVDLVTSGELDSIEAICERVWGCVELSEWTREELLPDVFCAKRQPLAIAVCLCSNWAASGLYEFPREQQFSAYGPLPFHLLARRAMYADVLHNLRQHKACGDLKATAILRSPKT